MSKLTTLGLKTFQLFLETKLGVLEYSTNLNRMNKTFEAKKIRKFRALNKKGIYIDPDLI